MSLRNDFKKVWLIEENLYRKEESKRSPTINTQRLIALEGWFYEKMLLLKNVIMKNKQCFLTKKSINRCLL